MDPIDRIFYINLDRRTDRRDQILEEFHRLGIPENKIERFPAIEHPMGCYGCSRSHGTVLKMAYERGYQNVLIFEDDFMAEVDQETWNRNLVQFFEKKLDWDGLLLTYNPQQIRPYDNLLSRVIESQSCAGYLVNRSIMSDLGDCFLKGAELLLQTGMHWIYTCDQAWKGFQQSGNWFLFNQRLGRQRPSWSDLGKCWVDSEGKW